MRVARGLRILCLAAACLACSERSAPGPAPRPSILIISIDTLRADHLGCHGYGPYDVPVTPAIDALAGQGVRFTQCYAPRAQTSPSLCSMMVGKYPSSHGVRDNGMRFAEGERTLAERLGAIGYRTAAFVSRLPTGTGGHPARGAALLEDGRLRPDGSTVGDHHESDEIVLRRAIDWLKTPPSIPGAPFFVWVHFYGAHKPYSPPPPYDALFTGGYRGRLAPGTGESRSRRWRLVEEAIDEATLSRTPLTEADQRFVLGLYDGGVRAVDDRVGRLLAVLDEPSLDQETLVVLTADHGEELGDHQAYYYHGNSVYASGLHIPLVLRWPGVLPPGTTFEHLVQNVDLVPTLLDWLHLAIPADIEGVSLAPWLDTAPPAPEPRRFAYVEWQDLIWGVRTPEYHYVMNPGGVWLRKSPFDAVEGDGFRIDCAELYHLGSDPSEQQNVVDSRPDVAAEVRAAAVAHRGRPAATRAWEGADTDALDELSALGYVGSTPDRDDALFGAQDCAQDR